MPTKLVVDCSTGIQTSVELTAEEITRSEADRVAMETEEAAQEAAATKAATDAAAGKAKLKELGLTDDQIAALVG